MNEHAMNETVSEPSTVSGSVTRVRPLRVWPALICALLMLAGRFGPQISDDGMAKYWMFSVFGPLLCCLLLVLWWLTASRATWRERVFGLLGIAASGAIAVALAHSTMRGAATTYLTLPLGFFVFAIATPFLRLARPLKRTGTLVLLTFCGFAVSLLLRNEGMTGDYKFSWRGRWTTSAEDALLAAGPKPSPTASLTPLARNSNFNSNSFSKPEWPGFRGADRDGRYLGGKISTNWTAHPPQPLWKIQIGPAWSSFAVASHLLFTQEQRGPKEAVVCYDADTGAEIWKTEVEARLNDPMGGPGPRATPTLGNGALFATGSTGTVLRLNPLTGAIVWKKDLTQIAGSKVPLWGFAASPLLAGPLVILYASGPGDKGLLAFDAETGELRWSASCPGDAYGSPQLNKLLDEDSVDMLTPAGLTILDPVTGKVRLDYPWKIPQYRALQPHVVGTDTILLPTGMNMGTRAIRLKKDNGQYAAEELWTSRQLKPDFVDLVSFQGCAYGNDGGLLTCLDLKTGERKWKGGRYGKGQILLLEKSGLLLVLSEQGQVALVEATPTDYKEIASFPALEGKTWNHPVVYEDRLYVRNSQQAAAYKLRLD